ncbi:MAG: serine hydrolase [Synechococcaceae cyanobacterium RM1_1_27]|nr:serine hydrolase [Synechococcaceae cyanobacterium SM2_3_2]NJO85572.1 serine hydrolase [Synechococcaceae cyanobacterium RM1_1_27]
MRRSSPMLVRRNRTLDPVRVAMGKTLGLSLALGLVVGTLGHLLNRPSSPQMAGTITLAGGQQEGLALSTLATEDLSEDIFLNQPQLELEQDLKALLEVPGLIPHVMTVDLDTGAFVDIRGSERVSAASVIKIPILVAFLQAVDRGEVRLDELLILDPDLAGGGSGSLQVRPYGSEVDALTAATMMITISDNYATNLIINRLGGREALNQTFQGWGLENTQISWLLPDLEGTNTVSPADVVALLQQVEAGELLSLRNRDRFFEIMRGVENRLLLPAGLGEGASIAHKTGNIRSVLADAGIIDMPNGHRYFVAVLLEREIPDDPRPIDLIPQASRLIYDYWQRFGEARLSIQIETDGDPEVSAER